MEDARIKEKLSFTTIETHFLCYYLLVLITTVISLAGKIIYFRLHFFPFFWLQLQPYRYVLPLQNVRYFELKLLTPVFRIRILLNPNPATNLNPDLFILFIS